MAGSSKKVLINALLLAVGAFFIWLAFRDQDFKQIWAGIQTMNVKYVLVSMMVLTCSHFVRALRWKQLMEPLGYAPTRSQVFGAVMIGYLANLALPRVGEFTRCGFIQRATGAPLDKLLGTVITERMVDLLSLLVLIVVALSVQYKILSSFFYNQVFSVLYHKMVGSADLVPILLGGCFLLIAGWILARRYSAQIEKHQWANQVQKFIRGLYSGFRSILGIKKKSLFYVYTLIIWLGYTVSSWLIFYSIAGTSGLGLSQAAFVLSAGSLGMVAPVQGGIGAYHWMVSRALEVYAVPRTTGLVYATINHTSGIVLIVTLGLFYLIWFVFSVPPIRNSAINT